MSGFEVAGIVLAAFDIAGLAQNVLRPAREYRQQRFGRLSGILTLIPFFDADSIQELHRNINYWGAEDLKAWKESYIASCNAIAVAASHH